MPSKECSRMGKRLQKGVAIEFWDRSIVLQLMEQRQVMEREAWRVR